MKYLYRAGILLSILAEVWFLVRIMSYQLSNLDMTQARVAVNTTPDILGAVAMFLLGALFYGLLDNLEDDPSEKASSRIQTLVPRSRFGEK